MELMEILQKTIEMKASDIHFTVNLPPMMRINGMLKSYGNDALKPKDTEDIAHQILDKEQLQKLEKVGEVDLSYVVNDLSRFRINVYKQKGYYCLAIRLIRLSAPTIDELGFPEVLKELAIKPRGLILVTGPTGSGKSTTLAAMVNHINTNKNCHVLTLEDPIEYIHNHRKSMVHQREIGRDSLNFSNGLRAALREDPDVILLGEMRDLETIATAITAAETGHLVMSTLHTTNSASTIDRVIDIFPPHQQQQIRVQLANVLVGVIGQQLLPRADGMGMIAALEILIATNAVRNLIRESKIHQINNVIQTSKKDGMKQMDYSLSELVRRGLITREQAVSKVLDIDMFKRYLMN